MTDNATTVMRLLEFTDSAFPVGTFSFSNGLETAAEEGLVYDAATLEQYAPAFTTLKIWKAVSMNTALPQRA